MSWHRSTAATWPDHHVVAASRVAHDLRDVRPGAKYVKAVAAVSVRAVAKQRAALACRQRVMPFSI